MRAEPVPRGCRAVRGERVVAEPAEAVVVESHGEILLLAGTCRRPQHAECQREGGGRSARRLPETLDQVEDAEDLGAVTDHLTVAGLPPAQHAVAVDDERRAPGDVAVGVEHAVRVDGRAVQVAQQRKRKLFRGGKGGVAGRAVTADGEHGRPALARALRDLDEVAQLGRSDAAPVEAVEDQHDVAAAEVRQADLAARGGGQRELGRGLAEAQAGHGAAVYPARQPVVRAAGRRGAAVRAAARFRSRSRRRGDAVRGEASLRYSPRRPRRAYESEDEMKDSEAYRKGAEMRRRLLGDAFVDRSTKTVYADPVMSKFIDVATETIFGHLWTRPGLDLKTRTLVCVVSDAATGREPELAIHLRMALRQGWTEEELTEVLIQLVGYVGAPFSRDALLVASRVFGEMRAEAAKG